MSPLQMPLGEAAVAAARILLEKGEIHLQQTAFFIICIMPNISATLRLLGKGIASKHRRKLMQGRNIEQQPSPGFQRLLSRSQKCRHLPQACLLYTS